MNADQLVTHLLESDMQGPPAPDTFTKAMGTAAHLHDLEKQKTAVMAKMVPSLGIERQLRKHGVTRQQVSSFIHADQKYPEKYSTAWSVAHRRGTLPPDAIVGMNLEDGREIIFDLAVMPAQP